MKVWIEAIRITVSVMIMMIRLLLVLFVTFALIIIVNVIIHKLEHKDHVERKEVYGKRGYRSFKRNGRR